MLYAPSVVAVGGSLRIKSLSTHSFALICFTDTHFFTLSNFYVIFFCPVLFFSFFF